MTVIAPAGTAESRAAALAMFEGQVPCLLQLADPSCPDRARWLAWFAHEENTVSCEASPAPVCDAHRRGLQAASHPFWRTWHQMPPVLCDLCGTPLRLERFEPLG
jgi:hypothetical protein